MNICDILYRHAGHPKMRGHDAGQCRICGRADKSGLIFKKWVGNNFTNHDLLKRGEIICHACQFLFAEKNTWLQEKVDKDKPQNMRTYSHFVSETEWLILSKAQKPEIKTAILSGKFNYCVIADSGKKHLLFRAQAGIWQFEETAIYPNIQVLVNLIKAIEDLLGGGFSKREINSGQYLFYRIKQFGLQQFHKIEDRLKNQRGKSIFYFAIFLAQKQEQTNGRKLAGNAKLAGNSRQVAMAPVARNSKGIQAEIFA